MSLHMIHVLKKEIYQQPEKEFIVYPKFFINVLSWPLKSLCAWFPENYRNRTLRKGKGK